MNIIKILPSTQDQSVNFIFNTGQEARFVRRTDEYFIAYLSSHNGCDRACRFCHLTQTGQTWMYQTSASEFRQQLAKVLQHYRQTLEDGAPRAERINLNWMARGEPLLNRELQGGSWTHLRETLRKEIQQEDLGIKTIRFNISTIMPRFLGAGQLPNYWASNLEDTYLYYSLYSLNPEFRKRWLPKAMDPVQALAKLAEWQTWTSGKIVLHWAFIEGENDSEQDAQAIIDAVKASGVRAKMNVVRYNPYSLQQGRESSEETILARFEQLKTAMSAPGSRIVPRVGFDVKASCGMFISQGDIDADDV